MEDSVSIKSNESIATSEEYEFVGKNSSLAQKTTEQPQLGIANNGNLDDLCDQLKEVLSEDRMDGIKSMEAPIEVGNSKFFVDKVSPQCEKQDVNKPDYGDDIDVFEDVQQECTIFNGVSYLGAASINAPKSDSEIQNNMAILNEQSSEQAIRVSISIPSSFKGLVVLYDAGSQQVMARYEIQSILFYARGAEESAQAACFAFTWAHGDSQESAIFQCHVFRCDITEAVGQVSGCFIKAFQRMPSSLTSSMIQSTPSPTQLFVFEVTLEVKEEDGKGGFTTVPKDRSGFRLRVNLEKILSLTVQQVSSNAKVLEVERCFGVLVSPGRNVKHSDMQLLETFSMGAGSTEKQACVISGQWDPTEPAFEAINVETSKAYITVAMDLVIKNIQEPVRFFLETPVKVYPQNERYWYVPSRRLTQQFYLNLRETNLPDCYQVLSIETSGELDRSRLNLGLNLANLIRSPSITSVETLTPKDETEDASDNDEPLLSGTGQVSKDLSVVELESWAEVLAKWEKGAQRPRELSGLVRAGIPEALRGELWRRLAGCETDVAMMDQFRLLIKQECNCEAVIKRDIHRTFPAHDFFKEAGGLGQDSLYRISKAYAVYDTEVGYCQGLSFLAATLLLHMPEEQAFCVLVRLMYDYGLRNLYKDGFECLYLRLFQLNRLLEEQLPQLWQHLADKCVESHMFASQWFLTVFTARFPLCLVFHILDVFLLQGIDTLFQVALALLTTCKKDLLQLDFENILKYFRVTMPKKCRSKETAAQIMKLACSVKVKKLKKYEREFLALKEAQDNADNYTNEMERLKMQLEKSEEEKKRLDDELLQVKNMLKREVDRADTDARRNSAIITEYKQICARLDKEQTNLKVRLQDLRGEMSKCEQCRKSMKEMESVEEVQNKESLERMEEESKNKDPALVKAQERIRELELELAQTKVERVEAECWKQELTHQLHSTLAELQTAKTSWIHKTISSIKEATNKKESEVLISQMEAMGPGDSGELIKKAFATRRAAKEEGDHRRHSASDQSHHAVSRMVSAPDTAPP